jgi:hypothetical protein
LNTRVAPTGVFQPVLGSLASPLAVDGRHVLPVRTAKLAPPLRNFKCFSLAFGRFNCRSINARPLAEA